jgi:hypothetical protein
MAVPASAGPFPDEASVEVPECGVTVEVAEELSVAVAGALAPEEAGSDFLSQADKVSATTRLAQIGRKRLAIPNDVDIESSRYRFGCIQYSSLDDKVQFIF